MQRQKSILSFFQKPLPPDGCNSSGGEQLLNFSSSSEIRGTDTPPEKVPRQRLPFRRDDVSSCSDTSSQPSLFSSIMHKFVKVADNKHPSSAGNHISGGSSNIFGATGYLNKTGGVAPQIIASNGFPKSNGKNDKEGRLHIELDDDDAVVGPETPGTRPLVPRLKRIQEDQYSPDDKNQSSLKNSAKRVKFLEDFIGKENNDNLFNETAASKFSWLDPSQIRDASGRRPDNILYDRKTLYIPPEALKCMSATQKQYWEAKRQYMDVVLFFKVGKFYELYELDAEIGHKELDWKMTFSGVGKCRQVGISESGIDDAVQKLLARGYKVGRMEQLETSEQAKSRGANSIIQRKLVLVFTPSTLVDGNIGPDVVHLLAIEEACSDLENGSKVYGFAFVDCAALKFWVGSISDDESCAALGALLMHVSPKEIICGNPGLSKEAQKALRKYSLNAPNTVQLTPVLPSNDFGNAAEIKSLIQRKGYFKGSSNSLDLSLNGIIHQDIAVSALGGLIGHLSRLLLEDTLCKSDISPYHVYGGSLRMDGQTLVNLEIFNNNADGGYSGTLYKYLDNCITSSGKRLLRNWICHPLREIEGINNRLNVVDDLMSHPEIMSLVAQYLRKLPDLERLLGRIKASTHPSVSLVLPLLGKKLIKQRVKVFGSLVKGLRTGIDMLMMLQKGGHLNSPFFKLLNLPLLGGTNGLNQFLSQFDAAIESDFPKYQDHNVMDADAETLSLLTELFIERATSWTQVIHAINCIDVLRSFAFAASFAPGVMSRPVLLPHSMSPSTAKENDQPTLELKGLWHPFALGENGGMPVPNDLLLGQNRDGFHPRTLLLTGPNMGGKSTLLRATCIAVILSQLGSYVPCEKCVLSLVDIIFTRLGASDRIMTGESTFFIECAETATILQSATQDSLVLLDELGRGTSTFDGYAIAYAVFRHLIEKVNCRLLFATHYHSLTKEFGSHPHVTLQHMACSFKPKQHRNFPGRGDQELVFLYRLSPGACPESYGLQVALMAGIPQQVVAAASDAGLAMKKTIADSYRSSEQRSEFSTLHEAWLKTVVAMSRVGTHPRGEDDDDFFTLLCLWHELRSSYQQRK